MWSPRILIEVLGSMNVVPKLMDIAMFTFLGLLERWSSSYFCGAKDAPWVRAHFRQISCALPRTSQFRSCSCCTQAGEHRQRILSEPRGSPLCTLR